jgi:hypothetical protein
MSGEWRDWVRTYGEEGELALTLGSDVPDAEIDLLCELASSGTVEAVPGQALKVNWVAEIRGFPPVVVEDPPGRWRLHQDIINFAARVFEGERSERRWKWSQEALVGALEELSEEHFRVLRYMCHPPQPLESAVHGLGIDDPDGFVSAVNTAAHDHGITDPVVEASAWTVRATAPPDLLVGAVLKRLSDMSKQRDIERLARFVARLGPDETALLRHITGIDIADEDALRRLDPAGESINDQAQHAGLTNRESPVPVLLRRDEHGRWQMHPFTRMRLVRLWRPPGSERSGVEHVT